jgi:hypothetical protein
MGLVLRKVHTYVQCVYRHSSSLSSKSKSWRKIIGFKIERERDGCWERLIRKGYLIRVTNANGIRVRVIG